MISPLTVNPVKYTNIFFHYKIGFSKVQSSIHCIMSGTIILTQYQNATNGQKCRTSFSFSSIMLYSYAVLM